MSFLFSFQLYPPHRALHSFPTRRSSDLYVQRNKFSPGTFSAPHFHPETRYIVVLKGTWWVGSGPKRSEEHTSELQSSDHLVCRLLLEKKKNILKNISS